MGATVRKNFVFDAEVAEHLEEIARNSEQSMTSVVQELIEKRHRELMVQKRIKAYERMVGSANGLLTDFSVQSVKAQMDV